MRPLNYNTSVLDEEGNIFELTQYIEDHGGGGGSITVDTELSLTSKNPVQNKVITAALNAQKVTVDSALSSTSENPVQNKVIKEALDAQKVTVDSALSSTSENPVQNKVITAALNKTWILKKSCSVNGNFTVDLNGCTEVLLVNRWSNLERFYANSSVAPLIVGAKYFIDGTTVNGNQNDKMNITINSLSQITVDGVSTSKSTEYNVNLYAK